MDFLQIKYIGSPASNTLEESLEFRIFGNTSRGLFLDLSSGRIVFISSEPYRGPLTLNLGSATDKLSLIKTGYKGSVAGRTLNFQSADISITWQDADVWRPVPPPQVLPDLNAIRAVLTPLQDSLLDAISAFTKIDHLSDLEQRILAVCAQAKAGDWQTALDESRTLLGRGTGLTPEGDDFLIGLSLALARAGAGKHQQEFIQQIVTLAEKSTTRLSAELLACAADGLADERLIDTYDALAANAPEAHTAIRRLLGWGSTSGRMALAGIAAGLLLR